MKNKILAAVGAAALAFTMSGTAEAQIVAQPCETCGVALGAPLPEGVFFVDLESYGQRDGQPNRLGVNIPIGVWSTPFTFYNTRLEVLAAVPVFTHIDGGGPTGLNRVDVYSQALLFAFAHDFGNGFNAAIIVGPRGADNFTNAGRGALADLRASISYVKDGFNATVTANYGGNLGGKVTTRDAFGNPTAGFDDNIFIDYTLTKKFNKFELGVIGYYETDINGPIVRQRALAVGGLVGYDFGKFTLQAFATREVYVRNGGWGLGQNAVVNGAGGFIANGNRDYETRGYVRLIVPLYVAPTAPAPVVARY